jgi:ADP-ribosylglycohydrolase
LAVSIGGDSDTITCIAGGIAETFYKEIPDYIRENVLKILHTDCFAVFIVEFFIFDKFVFLVKG